MKNPPAPRDGYELIFRPWIRTRDGRVLFASQFGLRAFPLYIRAGSRRSRQ